MLGELEKMWAVTCNECMKREPVNLEKKKSAESYLRRTGWTTRSRKWVCPRCSNRPEYQK